MNRLIVLFLALGLVIGGCYKLRVAAGVSHIRRIENKWGPPAKIEHTDETDIYYWYGKKRGGTVVVEFVTDKNGKVLKVRRYWKQPTP